MAAKNKGFTGYRVGGGSEILFSYCYWLSYFKMAAIFADGHCKSCTHTLFILSLFAYNATCISLPLHPYAHFHELTGHCVHLVLYAAEHLIFTFLQKSQLSDHVPHQAESQDVHTSSLLAWLMFLHTGCKH